MVYKIALLRPPTTESGKNSSHLMQGQVVLAASAKCLYMIYSFIDKGKSFRKIMYAGIHCYLIQK